MQWTLEVVQVPVADVGRSKEFYAGRLGFVVDIDHSFGPERRFVQLTPPGSGCSIQISHGFHEGQVPGSQRGLVLVVPDIRAALALLDANGVENDGVIVMGRDGSVRPIQDDDKLEDLDNSGMINLSDPDGNTWVVQQISQRGGR